MFAYKVPFGGTGLLIIIDYSQIIFTLEVCSNLPFESTRTGLRYGTNQVGSDR